MRSWPRNDTIALVGLRSAGYRSRLARDGGQCVLRLTGHRANSVTLQLQERVAGLLSGFVADKLPMSK
jgi:hypothetical protein